MLEYSGTEGYRSGHNEAVLKTVCPKGTRVRIPFPPPYRRKLYLLAALFKTEVFLHMNTKELKKEFNNKCKEEKRKCWQFRLIGIILSVVGLVIVIATLYVNFTTDFLVYPAQLVYLGIGAVIAVAGMIFDIVGDAFFKKDFERYLSEKQQ